MASLRISPRKHASTEKRLLKEAATTSSRTTRQKNKNMAMLLNAAIATEKYEKFELVTKTMEDQFVEDQSPHFEDQSLPFVEDQALPFVEDQALPFVAHVEDQSLPFVEDTVEDQMEPVMSEEDAQHIRDLEFLLSLYDQRNGYPSISDIYYADQSDVVHREGRILYELISAATVKACTQNK